FPFFRCHLRPTLRHPRAAEMRTRTYAQAAKENPAQSQQPHCLPEGNLPPTNMNAAIPRIAKGAIQSSLFAFGLMPCSSLIHKLVVNALQSFPQVKHGCPLA